MGDWLIMEPILSDFTESSEEWWRIMLQEVMTEHLSPMIHPRYLRRNGRRTPSSPSGSVLRGTAKGQKGRMDRWKCPAGYGWF